jgi:type IV pilus assembly protein PilA
VIQAIQKRLQSKDDEGFTLIELMVVVLIIAILIAIAIPTFLGARQRAQDRAAQSDLRNALLAVEVHYVDDEDYNPTIAELDAIEPELTYEAVADVAAGDLTVGFTGGADSIVYLRESASGTWFCIAKDEDAGTTYGSGATKDAVDTVAECAGASW